MTQGLHADLHTIGDRWGKKTQAFSILSELGQLIASDYSLNQLTSMLFESLDDIFSLAVGSVMLLDKKTSELSINSAIGLDEEVKRSTRIKLGQGIAGWVAQTGTPLCTENIERHEVFNRKNRDRYPTKSFFSVPLKTRNKILGVLNISKRLRTDNGMQEELELLSTFASHISLAIENIHLSEELFEEERLKKEMRMAGMIQRNILPKHFPEAKGIQIAAVNSSAHEMGGDFYDCFCVGKGKVGFIIGDVSGKSVPAGLFMTISKDIIHNKVVTNKSIREAMTKSNELITEESLFGMFVTVFYAVFDVSHHTLEYISAGHIRQIVYHPLLDEVEFLQSKGKPLGISRQFSADKKVVRLYAGDIILLFTDGIIEAINERYEEFGEKRLLKIIRDNAHLSAHNLMELIEQERLVFCQSMPQFDDLTMLIIKIEDMDNGTRI